MPPVRQLLSFADLPGWATDDHVGALVAYQRGWPHLNGSVWPDPGACRDARGFFETRFSPVLLTDDAAPLFTGYFEPELAGALQPGIGYTHPIHALPIGPAPYPDRAAIDHGALADPPLAWAADPVDLYFLHIQGSGRLALPDGRRLRLGYAGQNGHPYVSLGRLLMAEGHFAAGSMTADGLAAWLRADPNRARAAMRRNPSYVFFRLLDGLTPDQGPLGTLGCPLSPLRSAAVDRSVHPLGAPVWVETAGHARLMVAQDTGGAIKGAQRADLFFGTGSAAGLAAGRLASPGRIVTLLPLELL